MVVSDKLPSRKVVVETAALPYLVVHWSTRHVFKSGRGTIKVLLSTSTEGSRRDYIIIELLAV